MGDSEADLSRQKKSANLKDWIMKITESEGQEKKGNVKEPERSMEHCQVDQPTHFGSHKEENKKKKKGPEGKI